MDGFADYGLRAKYGPEGPPRINLLQLAVHITKQVSRAHAYAHPTWRNCADRTYPHCSCMHTACRKRAGTAIIHFCFRVYIKQLPQTLVILKLHAGPDKGKMQVQCCVLAYINSCLFFHQHLPAHLSIYLVSDDHASWALKHEFGYRKQVQQMPARVELAFSSDVATVEKGSIFPSGTAGSSKHKLVHPTSRHAGAHDTSVLFWTCLIFIESIYGYSRVVPAFLHGLWPMIV